MRACPPLPGTHVVQTCQLLDGTSKGKKTVQMMELWLSIDCQILLRSLPLFWYPNYHNTRNLKNHDHPQWEGADSSAQNGMTLWKTAKRRRREDLVGWN